MILPSVLCLSGMRLLPEEERLETLAILDQNRREVERQMSVLPIVIETPSQVRDGQGHCFFSNCHFIHVKMSSLTSIDAGMLVGDNTSFMGLGVFGAIQE